MFGNPKDMKSFFENKDGEIHFGNSAEEGFRKIEKFQRDRIFAGLENKKIWRCTVCNDLHIGKNPPKQCPTCFVMDAYVEINKKEFLEMIK